MEGDVALTNKRPEAAKHKRKEKRSDRSRLEVERVETGVRNE
jgi:hypothetical protein